MTRWSRRAAALALGDVFADVGAQLGELPRVVSDADIVRSSTANPDTFAVLYDRHVEAMTHYVERRLGHERALPVATAAFAAAFRHRHSFSASSDCALLWLLRHAAAEVHAERHGSGLYLLVGDPMRQALLGLADLDRELLLLTTWDGYDLEQAAQVFEIPTAIARSRVSRAQEWLRVSLSGDRTEIRS
jgi:DNA-directed RNA polymerase specialized sigma24 family protein